MSAHQFGSDSSPYNTLTFVKFRTDIGVPCRMNPNEFGGPPTCPQVFTSPVNYLNSSWMNQHRIWHGHPHHPGSEL